MIERRVDRAEERAARTLPLGVQKFMGDQFSDIGMVATGAMISSDVSNYELLMTLRDRNA